MGRLRPCWAKRGLNRTEPITKMGISEVEINSGRRGRPSGQGNRAGSLTVTVDKDGRNSTADSARLRNQRQLQRQKIAGSFWEQRRANRTNIAIMEGRMIC